MEGSKKILQGFHGTARHPHRRIKTFKSSEVACAIEYVKTCGHRVVLKADGLAGGKGVLIPETTEEAIAGLNDILVANVFGDAGSETSSPECSEN